MKNLQNNFTTPEQSKRLLELGVPADSADMYYHLENYQYYVRDEFSIKQNDFFEFYKNIFYPCWSVGRLMEICKICEPKKYYEELCEELQWSQNYCVVIISHIIANFPIIDFSKLDD